MKKNNKKNNNWRSTFKNAFQGCGYAFRTEKNFKVHLFFSFLVIFLGLWLRVSLERFLFLILAIVLVLSLEMLNTAIEALVNFVTGEKRPFQAGLIKDIAAAAVLLVTIGAVMIGFLILFPPLWQKIFHG